MIPRLPPAEVPASAYAASLDALRAAGFGGDLSDADCDRTVLATDNSIYRLVPQAIAFPRGTDDLSRIGRLLTEPRFVGVRIAPRGGGTGTNGQSLTDGLVVDVSRHMDRILEIDAEDRWVRVEAGVVKDQLNAALAPHGLFFAPELSTSNRATIGGMIGTDASGQGSCLYGKTRDHVLELTTVLADGTVWRSRPLRDDALREVQRADHVGAVHRAVDAIQREHAAEIEARFPRLNRCLTGYDLAHIRDREGRFDFNAVLCGSEGTLGILAEALGGRALPKVLLLQEWMAKQVLDGPRAAPALYRLLPHCTERTTATASMRDWQSVFARHGLRLEVLAAGCCGMAGTYGHEVEHRDTSEHIYGLSWRRHVAAEVPAGRLLASGHPCRSQAKRFDGAALPHPAQVLLRELRRVAETAGSAQRPAAKPPQHQAGAGPAGTGAPAPQADPVAG